MSMSQEKKPLHFEAHLKQGADTHIIFHLRKRPWRRPTRSECPSSFENKTQVEKDKHFPLIQQDGVCGNESK